MESNDFVLVPNGFGYEYRYKLRLDGDTIDQFTYKPSIGVKTFLFQLRTNFIVRTTEGEEILGSEKLYLVGNENQTMSPFLVIWLGRLIEYWFPSAAARKLFREALSFAREAAAQDPNEVIPVVVEFHVCTVQQPGEAAAATAERAIRPEHMLPIYVSAVDSYLSDRSSGGRLPIRESVIAYFLSMDNTRVENVDGLRSMNVCSICQRRPVLGAQIAHLRCRHTFHYHCIVSYLHTRDFCPLCVPENDEGVNNDDDSGDNEKEKRDDGSGDNEKRKRENDDDGGDNGKRKRENDDGDNGKRKRENDDDGGDNGKRKRENDDGGDNGKGKRENDDGGNNGKRENDDGGNNGKGEKE